MGHRAISLYASPHNRIRIIALLHPAYLRHVRTCIRQDDVGEVDGNF